MDFLESSGTTFSKEAFEEFVTWAVLDKKILKRINALIADIHRNGLMEGLGKPERLKHETECYSRRINEEHRLVYTVKSGALIILSCKGHYDS